MDGLHYELYVNMPDLLHEFHEVLYRNWQQNASIPKSVRRSVVTLIKNDENNRDTLENFRPITLLNPEFKILAELLAKRLVHGIDDLIEEAQTCAISTIYSRYRPHH